MYFSVLIFCYRSNKEAPEQSRFIFNERSKGKKYVYKLWNKNLLLIKNKYFFFSFLIEANEEFLVNRHPSPRGNKYIFLSGCFTVFYSFFSYIKNFIDTERVKEIVEAFVGTISRLPRESSALGFGCLEKLWRFLWVFCLVH